MLTKHTAYKYETLYTGPFLITWCWTNGTVSFQIGVTEIRYNICCINPYKSDTKVENYNSINIHYDVNIWYTYV